MPNQLFSTYSQGENRVTGSILAVFERISFLLLERILQSLCQEPETALVTFTNQLVSARSVPDARIRGSFAYWIETKTVLNGVRLPQIRNHLEAVEADTAVEQKRLIVLTPDARIPPELAELNDPRVAWASFDQLVAAITDVVEPTLDWMASDRPIATESERTLLRELVQRLEEDGSQRAGQVQEVFLLSPPESPDTLVLRQEVQNDTVSETGKPTAFVQGQRYVPLARLEKGPSFTSELVAGSEERSST